VESEAPTLAVEGLVLMLSGVTAEWIGNGEILLKKSLMQGKFGQKIFVLQTHLLLQENISCSIIKLCTYKLE